MGMIDSTRRLKIMIRGLVQGVGFRPFVYRLAESLSLKGWVTNAYEGIFIEAEGPLDVLQTFLLRLEREKPSRSFIQSLESSFLDPKSHSSFQILPSRDLGNKSTLMMPDIAACDECLKEVFDPGDRRFQYPFTNCTHCGPRFSILEALPYDRRNTSMKAFPMCRSCLAEY